MQLARAPTGSRAAPRLQQAPAPAFRHLPLPPPHARSMRRPAARLRALDPAGLLLVAELGYDEINATAQVLGMGSSEKLVLLASVAFSALSLSINFWGRIATEKTRAELAIEVERERQHQRRLVELYDVTARYRGPLLEAAVDLEQALWHLVTDPGWRARRDATSAAASPAGLAAASPGGSSSVAAAGAGPGGSNTRSSAGGCEAVECAQNEISYLLFTLAQFLGFLEVLRLEGPRERNFFQAGNPHGSDTLLTLVEGIRFVLCASQSSLQRWYLQGRDRPHPGSRSRGNREEVIRECLAAQHNPEGRGSAGAAAEAAALLAAPSDAFLVSRGTQRAIGSQMMTTPAGSNRHYTLCYSEFWMRLQGDPAFARWFGQLEQDARLLSCACWAGETPFPPGRWSRVLLLQQLLVELMDLLDPDCVRLPLSRRTRLMPVRWGPLPGVEQYQAQLKALLHAFDLGAGLEGAGGSGNGGGSGGSLEERLGGIRDLLLSFGSEDAAAEQQEEGAGGASPAALPSAGSESEAESEAGRRRPAGARQGGRHGEGRL